MNLFTYRLLTTLALPLIAYHGWKRCKKQPNIPNCFGARFGFSGSPFQQGGIWVHAVSVGETRSIFPLLSRLKATYPKLPLTVTSGSTQGALQALQFAPVEIQHQMIPYDYPFAVNRFLNQIQPKLVIMVETEIWPNLYQACFKRNIPILLVNARLKEKSFLTYQKWGGEIIQNALNQTQLIATQFSVDSKRFQQLGATPDKIKTLGNLKFDLDLPPNLEQQATEWKASQQLNHRFIWVAASTHAHPDGNQPSEEQLMLQAHQQLIDSQANNPNFSPPLLILVPRHADRFDEVAQQIADLGLTFARRSQNQPIKASTQVYLADSIGELMLWFACCDVAFIGGSLVPFGGHNILEPAALKKPVLSGPHYSNLQALFDTFSTNGALTITQTAQALGEQLIQLSQSPKKCQPLGQKAHDSFCQNSGTLNKLLLEINTLLNH
ncbi:3-deoxy-D-manno-octulosonic acid transferase [hydrothermal vent metagenome]|uniref:3-deoxy-D-manno-octulosonic acid transferase n=1 Tax=hydrothermal vent metagenome TaxID=652676 RepID=A0A3B0WSL2_9ZZZZ